MARSEMGWYEAISIPLPTASRFLSYTESIKTMGRESGPNISHRLLEPKHLRPGASSFGGSTRRRLSCNDIFPRYVILFPNAQFEIDPSFFDAPGRRLSFLIGGAFVYAAGGAAIYDGRVLCTISKEDFNILTIIISVNFRLGVSGFLASEEIREYNKEFGEDGVGNYGLWDQVEALRWTKKHIAAFDGNPDRVCVFGQSAGGVSRNIHLARNEPLFSSVIIQPGLIPLCGIMTVPQYQVIYDKMLKALKISADLSRRERLQRLIDAPEAEVTAAMVPVLVTPVITLSPCDDGVLIGGPMPKYSEYVISKSPDWCPNIMIGDVKNECMIWNKAYRAQTESSILSLIRSFPFRCPGGAEKVIELYDLRDDMSNNETFWKIEKLCTDGLYAAVDWIVVRANPNIYAYHFDVPSSFDNAWGGLAHHS